MKFNPLFNAVGIALVLGAAPALAGDKSMDQAVSEARLEGQIGTAILLNRHLNPFEISVDVEGDTAILTGTVDESIDKELAERVAHWHLAGLEDAGPRGGTVDALAQRLDGTAAASGARHATVAHALEALRGKAKRGDRVLVFGSFHTAASALEWLAAD